jgi:hypothetical protein
MSDVFGNLLVEVKLQFPVQLIARAIPEKEHLDPHN